MKELHNLTLNDPISKLGSPIDWEALRTVVRTRTAPSLEIDLILSKVLQLALCPPPFMLILTNRVKKFDI